MTPDLECQLRHPKLAVNRVGCGFLGPTKGQDRQKEIHCVTDSGLFVALNVSCPEIAAPT